MALKFLMVCTGNICRSPIAHGLLQHKVEQFKLDWKVDSAGTIDFHEGELPDKRAIECLKRYGIDITCQRSRPVNRNDIQDYDLIYAMDKSHYDYVLKMARTGKEKQKIKLIMDEVHPGAEMDVPDPYYGGDAGFKQVYDMLDKATDKIIEKYNVS